MKHGLQRQRSFSPHLTDADLAMLVHWTFADRLTSVSDHAFKFRGKERWRWIGADSISSFGIDPSF